jgi:hypothetical protein
VSRKEKVLWSGSTDARFPLKGVGATPQDSELAAQTCWWSGSARRCPASDSGHWPHPRNGSAGDIVRGPRAIADLHLGGDTDRRLPRASSLPRDAGASPALVSKWVVGMQPALLALFDRGAIASGWRRSGTRTIFAPWRVAGPHSRSTSSTTTSFTGPFLGPFRAFSSLSD